VTAARTSKPERILSAARRLLAERGHAAVTISEIAREAGVSRGLLHYYFESKEHILAQVVRQNVEQSIEETSGLLREAVSRDELIRQFLRAYQEAVGRGTGYALYFEAFVQGRVHETVRAELADLFQARRDSLADALRAAEERGHVKLAGEPRGVASLILALGDGVALQYLADPEMPILEAGQAVMPLISELLGGTATGE
jgi:AcrR family transcriptional regulator